MSQPNVTELLKAKLSRLHKEADAASSKSLAAFLNHIVIDSAPDPKPYRLIAENWQVQRNDMLVPVIEHVAGVRPDYKGPLNVYCGYGKGHDKTSTVARYLNWLAAYPKKTLRVVCAAKDREQSEILRDVMEKEAGLSANKWFKDHIQFGTRVVTGKRNGTKIEFLTSDASGSHGRTPDLICLDECTNWDSSALFEALFSATVKRAGHCGLILLTNAGYLGSWQREIRDLAEAENGKTWLFFEQKVGERLASWMTPEAIDQASKFLSPTEARRLYGNEWIDPSEAGIKLFSPRDVDACVGKPLDPPPGAQVYFSIDYGGTCDRTAMAVLWYDTNTSTVHVVKIDCYQGSPENEVRIADVERWMDLHWGMYPDAVAVIDVLGQLLGTAQKYEDAGRIVKRVRYRGGQTNAMMCQCLRSLLTNRRIVFAPNCGLIGGSTLADELKSVVSKVMAYGERLDHRSSEHDDRAVVVGQGAMQAIQDSVPGAVPQKPDPEADHHKMLQGRPSLSTHFLDRTHAARRQLFGLRLPTNH
jgi:hypothetical protein